MIDGVSDLPFGKTVQDQPDDPTRPGPLAGREVGFDAAGEEKPAGTRIVVDCALDRAQDLRHLLPLIEENWFLRAAQCRVRVRGNRRGDRGVIQPEDVVGDPPGGGRLSRGTRAGDHDGGQACEQTRQAPVSDPRNIP